MSFGTQPAQQYEVVDYRGDLSPEVGTAPSPDGSPGPNEPSYVNFTYGYPWPQSDMRSLPPASYAIAAPNYPRMKEQLVSASGAYAFHA
jgi:hypothetical protein